MDVQTCLGGRHEQRWCGGAVGSSGPARGFRAYGNSCSMLKRVQGATSPDFNAAELSGDEVASVLAGQAEVVDAVLAASRVLVGVAAGALADLEPEVTMPQFRALVLIDMHETLTVAHLADALAVVPSTATRMCDRLVAKHLIKRTTDRTNRRQVTLRLQPRGRRLIEESTAKRTREINALLTAVPAEAQTELAHALGLLVQAALGSDRTRASGRPVPDPSLSRTARDA
ncbi:MAG: MarR family transcriptional regulator [Humibacillus sp.]|nr:MarR family transcriptional regulator [Humibacillus sp.]MDN5776310.1 MarR family transcriptional regulator [Humibacillus sp.]